MSELQQQRGKQSLITRVHHPRGWSLTPRTTRSLRMSGQMGRWPVVTMQFEEESYAGGDGGQDSMMGMFTSLNIVDISEVFSPPRVVMQGMKIGLKAGSSTDLFTGWNFELKADRDRAMRQLDEEEPMPVIGSLSTNTTRGTMRSGCRDSMTTSLRP